MTRTMALILALLAALTAVSSTCLAQPGDLIRFTLDQQRNNSEKIHANFRHTNRNDHDNNWSGGFTPSELVGLEVSSFHAAGTRALHFSITREAGRLDCTGSGGGGLAGGLCRFVANPAFTALLVSHGIGRPTQDQMFGLMAVNAHRELIDALTQAQYPTPRIDDIMALSALAVDGHYITAMSHAGYRPRTLQSLVEFKALGISAEWISGFVRIGYANLPVDSLAQIRAIGITPEYIAGFDRIGYRKLPIDTLVQLKALDITPQFVRAVANGGPLPPVGRLAELKMFARRP